MHYIDQHMHTDSSLDCKYSMSEMAEAAKTAGLEAICFTDHCDLIYYDKADEPDPDCFRLWSRAVTEYNRLMESFSGNTKIRIGMELGGINQVPENAKEYYKTPGLDFTLGSVHSIRNHTDLFMIEYKSYESCYKIVDQYIDENIETARLGYFDVLAHIGYTNRYMMPCGFQIDYRLFTDKLCELFDIVAENGKGIELNTSGLRQEVGSTFPTLDMMKLYRERGGEIVTLGSDAHRPQDVGSHLKEGLEILLNAGFKYFAVFEEHKPSFMKIE